MPRTAANIFYRPYPHIVNSYHGCSHRCKYCCARDKAYDSFRKPQLWESPAQVKNFCEGVIKNKPELLSAEFKWMAGGGPIPLYFSTLSEPFQPFEKVAKNTLAILKVFREYKYPFILMSKGIEYIDDEYFDVLKDCNFVLQPSITAPCMDKLEPYAPPYEERIKVFKRYAGVAKQMVFHASPYIREALPSILKEIPRLADLGVDSVHPEQIRIIRSMPIKLSGRFVATSKSGQYSYPAIDTYRDYLQIKAKAERYGMHFQSGNFPKLITNYPGNYNFNDEYNLDGIHVKGWHGNWFQGINLLWYNAQPTEGMKRPGTGVAFQHADKTTAWWYFCKEHTFEECMRTLVKRKETMVLSRLGIKKQRGV